MKGILRAAMASGVLLSSAALGLQAQARVILGIGAGPTLPMKSGFNAVEDPPLKVKSLGFGGQFMFGILPAPDSKVSIRFDIAYDNVHYEMPTPVRDRTPKMSIRNINADIVIHPSSSSSSKIRPYVLAGPTLVSWDYRTGVTTSTAGGQGRVKGAFGFNGGAGLNIGTGKNIWFFVESRFIWTSKQAFATGTNGGMSKATAFIPIVIGIRLKPMEGK
jgi:hypothetical protein